MSDDRYGLEDWSDAELEDRREQELEQLDLHEQYGGGFDKELLDAVERELGERDS